MDRNLIDQLIEKHEGRRTSVYKDSLGLLTIGVGWNLEDPTAPAVAHTFGLNLLALQNGTECLSDEQIDDVLSYQVSKTILALQGIITGWESLPDNAQAVCVDMAFNLGIPRFSGFRKFIAAVEAHDWPTAVNEMVDSNWYHQVTSRAQDDVALLKEIA
jgi:lysozyme